MRVLYLDCFSGISGDMSLAALVDAGADKDYVESELEKIKIEPFHLQWDKVVKQGISATKLSVITEEEPHGHRHYARIVELIEQAGFNEKVTKTSLAIFQKIGQAEAKIHNMSLEKVHFHEVGAIDSIADAVGFALALDSLNVDQIIASSVPVGSGMIWCDHGWYPVPAPATLEMLKGIPIAASKHKFELTTPTGAGIVSSVVNTFKPSLPAMKVEAIGYGAGTRDLPNQPNVLRVVVGTLQEQQVKPNHSHTHGHAQFHEHGRGHAHSHEHGHAHFHEHGHAHSHEHHNS